LTEGVAQQENHLSTNFCRFDPITPVSGNSVFLVQEVFSVARRIPQLIRADDFVAEALEAIADKLAPSEKVQEQCFRAAAKSFRESGRSEVLRLWENTQEAEAFIGSDFTSVR
jgi:hypothetical protein